MGTKFTAILCTAELEAGSCFFIEERLETEGGRDLIDNAAVVLAGMASLV